jgi:alanyl-tRNA synthetase
VGDTGVIRSCSGAVVRVVDTVKIGDVVFHHGTVESTGAEAFGPGDALRAEIDSPRRAAIAAHHTSTHLLNWALRHVLGDHVMQRGSLVDPEKTRFDFSHGKAMTDEEITRVQQLVNDRVSANLPVHIAFAPQADALKIKGLRAVFGEKYPPQVRVVSIGVPVKDLLESPDEARWMDYSVEFCGGTHLASTAGAGHVVILSEEAVGKGVRRIVAVGGQIARRAIDEAKALSSRMAALAGAAAESLEREVAWLTEAVNAAALPLVDRAELRRKLTELQSAIKDQHKKAGKAAEGAVVQAARKIAEAAGDDLVVTCVDGATAQTLRVAMDVIRAKRPGAAMMLAATGDGKIAFLAAVPDPLIQKGLKAGDWVREVAKAAGGSGGGRPDMAQAGGKDPAKLDEALAVARTFAAGKLG